MKKHELTEELINKIAAYLGTRPFMEVNMLISEIFTQCQEKKNEDNPSES